MLHLPIRRYFGCAAFSERLVPSAFSSLRFSRETPSDRHLKAHLGASSPPTTPLSPRASLTWTQGGSLHRKRWRQTRSHLVSNKSEISKIRTLLGRAGCRTHLFPRATWPGIPVPHSSSAAEDAELATTASGSPWPPSCRLGPSLERAGCRCWPGAVERRA